MKRLLIIDKNENNGNNYEIGGGLFRVTVLAEDGSNFEQVSLRAPFN